MEIAQRVNSLAQKESDPTLIMGAYRSLAESLYSSVILSARAITQFEPFKSGDQGCNLRSKRSTYPWSLA